MDDRPLGTPYKGRIQYLLHVRKSWPHFCTTNCAKVGLAGAKRCRKTDSRLTPNNLSSPYLCVLLSRHSCLIVNNIRDCAVTHNPKVAGSNPAPATNPFNNLGAILRLIPRCRLREGCILVRLSLRFSRLLVVTVNKRHVSAWD